MRRDCVDLTPAPLATPPLPNIATHVRAIANRIAGPMRREWALFRIEAALAKIERRAGYLLLNDHMNDVYRQQSLISIYLAWHKLNRRRQKLLGLKIRKDDHACRK